MPYTQENNYIPDTLNDLMTRFLLGVNKQFNTSFTLETFIGTGF